MKRLMTIVALVVLLPATASAGEIPSGDAPQPTPPGSNRPKSSFFDGQTTLGQVGQSESDQASLDPWQSLMLAILSLLAR
jgi:hypothetical protein